MTKRVKGNSRKSDLNRSILHQGWGELVRQIEYKLEWRGGNLIKVDPRYTSQKCRKCGHIEKANRKSQEHFECKSCGHTENADINASKNILAAGLAVLARGENISPNENNCNNKYSYEAVSVKREPAKDTKVSVGNP